MIVTPAASDSVPAPRGPRRAAPVSQPREGWAPVHVEVCSVVRTFGRGPARRDVLGGLTHDFAPGQMTVITGRSGAGKTTLLELIAGLDRPSSGQILLDGHPLGELSSEQLASLRRQRIGYLSQEAAPIGFLSAQENVVLSLRIRGWDADDAALRAAEAQSRAGLDGRSPSARPPALGRGSPARWRWPGRSPRRAGC